jgi:hypothetical protein
VGSFVPFVEIMFQKRRGLALTNPIQGDQDACPRSQNSSAWSFGNLRAGSYRKQAHLCPKVSFQVALMREVQGNLWKLFSD